jgi:hypothetical protein
MIEYLFIIFLVIIIIIVINLLYSKYDSLNESFDDFSPYQGDINNYPFVYERNIDQELLQKTLKPWERPFNCLANAGYTNAEPLGIPPRVSICSFESKKYPRF